MTKYFNLWDSHEYDAGEIDGVRSGGSVSFTLLLGGGTCIKETAGKGDAEILLGAGTGGFSCA